MKSKIHFYFQHFYAKGSHSGSGLAVYNAKKHCEKQHGVSKASDPKQQSIQAFGKTSKKKVFSRSEKDTISNITSKWIVTETLPLNAGAKDGFLNFLEQLHTDVYGYDKESFSDVKSAMSRAKIIQNLEKSEATSKEKILENKSRLISEGKLFILLDHWHCNRGSYEPSNSYHGILLGIRLADGSSAFYPLRFSSASQKTSTAIKEELKKTLEVKIKTDFRFGHS